MICGRRRNQPQLYCTVGCVQGARAQCGHHQGEAGVARGGRACGGAWVRTGQDGTYALQPYTAPNAFGTCSAPCCRLPHSSRALVLAASTPARRLAIPCKAPGGGKRCQRDGGPTAQLKVVTTSSSRLLTHACGGDKDINVISRQAGRLLWRCGVRATVRAVGPYNSDDNQEGDAALFPASV